MKRLFTIGVIVLCAQIAGASSVHTDDNVHDAWVTQNLASQPLAFTKNMGQWPDSILYRANAGGAVIWFVRDGIYYQYSKRIPRPRSGEEALAAGLGPRQVDPDDRLNQEPDSIVTAMIKAEFVGSNPSVEVVGLDELDYKCNYFIGNDPSGWHTDVPNYSGFKLRGLYPGVDAEFTERDGRLECRLTASFPEDLAQVRIEYFGVGAVTKETENRVSIQTVLGEKRFAGILPLNETEPAGASIASTESPNAGVSLLYSTYLGGGSYDIGNGIAVDGSGNVYVTGITGSTNFPTQNPYQTDPDEAFVTKLSAAGNSLVYSTYLGGGSVDFGYGIAVDGNGNAYVTGSTTSTNFPTQNPYQTDPGDGKSDVFVTKLSAAGNSLVYSTYLGGGSFDLSNSIALDESGNAYVTGWTNSTNFPTQNPYQGAFQGGDWDVFVTKLSAAGNSLVYSTYLGGGNYDRGYGIAVDGSGNAYVTGYTGSTDFPTQNPYQTDPGDGYSDVFVTKLSADGTSLQYSTYLGGNFVEIGFGITVDGSGNAYVTGYTGSTDFPTQDPYQTNLAYEDVFVTKLSATGNSLLYSTYLGGANFEYGYGIAVDASGNAYMTGYTASTNFPTQNPYQTYLGNRDAFVTKLSSAGNSLVYSTYLGGGSLDHGYGIAVDGNSNAYVTGYTVSTNFPTQNPYQTDQGGEDVFVTKLSAFADSDLDGVPDDVDNCPSNSNPLQEDEDSDTVGDACDSDDDNDGVLDASDTNPLNPDICADADGDGCDDCSVGTDNFGPLADNQPANDGIDTDADGLCNTGDPDDDNDGVLDAADTDPLNPDICADADADGCDDCSVGTDNFGPLADNLPANDGTDTDADGICNTGDPDDDNDGVADVSDTDPLNPDVCADADADGCDDCSVGTDNFGPLADNLPANDGADTDADGICNTDDNCPTIPNPGQEDTDGDNIGDACDGCCVGRVGDVNGEGDYPDEVTLGDIMLLVDVKFISGDCSKLPCLTEADVNQDGGANPTCEDHVTLGDIMILVDFLFITGPDVAVLKTCL